MLVVASAGDDESFVCHYSPASSNRVITAGGTRRSTDTLLQSSNFGDCIDIHAPGEFIWSKSNGASLSGSSLATSIVAGMAAQLIAHINSQPKLLPSYNKLDQSEKLRFLRQTVLSSSSGGSSVHELPFNACKVSSLLQENNPSELTNIIANGINAFVTNRGARRIMDSVKRQMKLDTKTGML